LRRLHAHGAILDATKNYSTKIVKRVFRIA